MAELLLFVCIGLAFFVPWKIWYQGIKMDELKAELHNTSQNLYATQQVAKMLELTNSTLSRKIELMNSDIHYWMEHHGKCSVKLENIAEYLYKNDLHQSPSGEEIMNIIDGDDEYRS